MIEGHRVIDLASGAVLGALVVLVFLPMVLKATLREVAIEAAQVAAQEIAIDVRKAIADAKPGLADTKGRVDSLLGAATETIRKRLEEKQE